MRRHSNLPAAFIRGSALTLLTLVLALSGLLPVRSSAAPPRPVPGGVMRVAHIGEPPTLDLHFSTAVITSDIASNIFEGLFGIDSKFETKPVLIDSWSLSNDRLVYTFRLRRGVRFHNGKEMTADDVTASLSRWGRLAVGGRRVFAVVNSLTSPDPLTVVVQLKEPYALLPLELAYSVQAAAIYPKEVVEEAGTGPVRRFIGTGPYRFVEHLPDRHIRLDRFDGYQARTEPGDGFSGRKGAYVDSIYFHPVPDTATRIAGVRRGDFHLADSIPQDEYERLRGDPNLVTAVPTAPAWLPVIFNHRSGLMSDRRVRQAFQAAIDCEAVLQAAVGPRRFWRLEPGLMPRGHPMASESGKEFFNQKNPERARKLLEEAGYKREPIRWITTMEYAVLGTAAQVAKPMLEKAGFVVDLQVVDWATLMARRGRPELWDVFQTWFSFQPDPAFMLVLQPGWPGWYDNRDMNAMMALLRRHSNPKVRLDLWSRMQRYWYEDAASIKFGDFFLMHLHRKELRDYVNVPVAHVLWNAWMERR